MPALTEAYCLFCGKKVPFYRMVGQQQPFCSSAHETSFQQEQTRLAVETLHRTHDALKAYKPAVAVEDILGPDPTAGTWEQPSSQIVGLAQAVQRPVEPPPPSPVHFGESVGKLDAPAAGFWARVLRWFGLS